MRTIHVGVIAMTAAVLGSLTTLAAQKQLQRSTVFEWAVKEGTVETLQNGKPSRLGPGSIIFHSSNDLHNIRNAGTTPATSHVIQWRGPGAVK